MNKEYCKDAFIAADIEKILTDLTNALGFDNQNDNHKDAYILAFDRLCSLVDSQQDNKDEKLTEIKKKIIEKSTFDPGTSFNYCPPFRGWYKIYKNDLDLILPEQGRVYEQVKID